jgi:hypothetical protein
MTKRSLQIATEQTVPIDVVTEALGWLGRRGSGKTYGAQRAAELMHDAGAQFVAIDPVGNWWALRLAADEKSPGIQIPVFGGLRGDVPLEATAGRLIADVIVDRGVSAVVDISQFESDAEKGRFAHDFAARLFFRKKAEPSALHLFLEEAQEIIPQNPNEHETKMLNAFQRIAKLGRNYGIGFSVLSRHPQEVHKKVLNLVEILFAFQLTGPHERKAVAGWIKDKGIDEDIDAILPKLRVGAPHVWSPVLLGISKVVHVTPKWTFDASQTPKVGQRATVRELAPIDLEQLGKEIAASREKAEANDPTKLKAKIIRLEHDLARMAIEKPRDSQETQRLIAGQVERAMEPRMRESATHMAASYNHALERMREGFIDTGRSVAKEYESLMTRLIQALQSVELPRLTDSDIDYAIGKSAKLPVASSMSVTSGLPSPPSGIKDVFIESGRRGGKAYAREIATKAIEATRMPDGLGKGEHTILRAIAQHHSTGVDLEQLTVLTGYKKSSRNTYLQRLTQAGLAWRDDDGTLHVTNNGMKKLGSDFQPLPTGRALRDYWMDRLPDGERRLLEPLLNAWPKSLHRDHLDGVGYQRSSRNTYLQRLGARKLIETGKSGLVKASDLLFDQ